MAEKSSFGAASTPVYTKPITVCKSGRLVPLVGMAACDGVGRLSVALLYSDHEGLEILRPHALTFGIGRNASASPQQLEEIVRNPIVY